MDIYPDIYASKHFHSISFSLLSITWTSGKEFHQNGLTGVFFSPPFGFFPYISKADRAGYSCWKLRYSMAGPHEKKPLFFHNRKPYRWDSYGGRLIVRGGGDSKLCKPISLLFLLLYLSIRFPYPEQSLAATPLWKSPIQFNPLLFVFRFLPTPFPSARGFSYLCLRFVLKGGGEGLPVFLGFLVFGFANGK